MLRTKRSRFKACEKDDAGSGSHDDDDYDDDDVRAVGLTALLIFFCLSFRAS